MKRKTVFIAGMLAVFAGYVTGVLTVLLGGGASDGYVEEYLSASPAPRWWEAFCNGPGFILLALCFGVFFFGWLLIFPLVFYKAYGYGYTAGLFLAALGTKGFLPLALCLFPAALAECALLAFVCREAFPLSFALFGARTGKGDAFEAGLRPYLLHGLVLLQCSSFVLLWDLFLSPRILSGIREML